MESLDFREFAIQTYSKLVEESILLYLQSKEAIAAFNITPEKEKELRCKIKDISKKIATEIINELISKDAFEKGFDKSEEKKIIQEIIKKYIENEK